MGYSITSVLIGAMTGSLLTGYAQALLSNQLGQAEFYVTMKLDPSSQHGTDMISVFGGIFFAGGFIGTLFTAWTSEVWGRLRGFQIAAFSHVVGAVIQTASMNQAMFTVSRFLCGFATGQTSAAMVAYYSEISLPKTRGLNTGLHALLIELGAVAASWIGVGCFYSTIGTFGWRFPVSLSVLIGLIFLVVSFFLPESPRWLVRYGKLDEAYIILQNLHRAATSHDETIAAREFEQIKLQSEADAVEVAKHGRWKALFVQAAYRKRLLIGFGVVCFTQSCGFLVIYNYGVMLYSSLGLSTAEALMSTSGWISWTGVCILIGNVTVDRMGRRLSLIIGFIGLAISLAIFTACLKYFLDTQDNKYAVPAVTFLYITALPFGACLDNNQFTVVSEIFPNHLRTLASCLCISGLYLMQTLWLNVAPTAMNTISWKFYLVFIILSFCGAIHVYFFLPETKNVPLEELDALFGHEIAIRLEDVHLESPQQVEVKGSKLAVHEECGRSL
ncbi:putative MFS sugar transporter [Fonsecaea pedrosoi]|nr:putative MFS sugar transporter [Fonsecaea pedrosoi]